MLFPALGRVSSLKEKDMDNIALIIVIIGALNCGSIGLFGVDLIATLFGGQHTMVSRIIYSIVGLAGLWSITILFKEKLPVKDR
jgi:uncharacterized membrane protein YuzA (DUF378 family)